MEKSLYEFLQAILHIEYEIIQEFTMEIKIESQEKCQKEFVLESWKIIHLYGFLYESLDDFLMEISKESLEQSQ